VLIDATSEGKKELIGFEVGVRESAQSWREQLVDLKSRGLSIATEVAVGDGALGFWKAVEEIFPGTRHQRCWLHKIVNVLDKIPLSVQPKMKQDLREICLAPNRALNVFAEKYRVKSSKALLTFYDLPAEHWELLRTTNPIAASSRRFGTGPCAPRARSRLPQPS
jgi:putative transposase